MARKAERVTTLNVNRPGRAGARIARDKYDAVKKAILDAVPRGSRGLPFKELFHEVDARVPRALFRGASVDWYTTTVKLDLEARGLIKRVEGATPQRLVRAR